MKLLALTLVLAPVLAAEVQTYCWGFLNAHPDRVEIPAARAHQIQAGHMAHMGKMAEAGRLLAAGPLASPGGPRGLLVYRCNDVGEAIEWTRADPAVVNKRLSVELYAWRGDSGWGEPLATKLKADPKYAYKMVQLPFAILMRTEKMHDGASPPAAVGNGHLEYMKRLVAAGKLRSFGGFIGSPQKIGVWIYASMPVEEAWKLAEADPLVKNGWARPVMHVWFVADEAVPGSK